MVIDVQNQDWGVHIFKRIEEWVMIQVQYNLLRLRFGSAN